MATFVPSAIGLYHLVATVTDLDGYVTRLERVLKVRDPADTAAPAVEFDSALAGSVLTADAAVVGSIVDANLESWRLELSTAVGRDVLAQTNSDQDSGLWLAKASFANAKNDR